MTRSILYILAFLGLWACAQKAKEAETSADTTQVEAPFAEKHRPQLHFSPQANWMNDPNGLVFHKGEYHLFYQHYPEGNKWGPMHWGHAVSKDLIHWNHLPIALYPDSLGWIFSGSAVVDKNNTSGLGTSENPPLVAIYTYHSSPKEKAGRKDYQYQGIAYSNDDGRSWKKYAKNPVLPNQGINDFRDPKVFWHDQTNKWVMILAVKDHVEFWGSKDLKSWRKLSDFGVDYGSHGGVWECPDLFPLSVDGKAKWVMLLSINPGGPNGGSATQYFVGDFDGTTFKASQDKKTSLWLDYGPDNYAGVTWSNAPDGRRIFIGWMSNWDYADRVPTTVWRSANTLPRELSLTQIKDKYYLKSALSPELMKIAGTPKVLSGLAISDSVDLSKDFGDVSMSLIRGQIEAKDFSIQLSGKKGEKLVIGFDAENKTYFIDRSLSGKNDFADSFKNVAKAQRISEAATISFEMVVDVSSVEVFFDDGLSVMTAIHFPEEVLSNLAIKAPQLVKVDTLQVSDLHSIWQ